MNSEQHEAEIAAEQDAKTDVNKLVWICVGLFGNIIGVLIAYIYQPTPPASRLFEKSEAYKVFYTDTYKVKARNVQLIYAAIGLAIIVGIYIIIQIVAISMIVNISKKARQLVGFCGGSLRSI